MGVFDLGGKLAVVTGGSGYLGRDFCRALIDAGATVISLDIVSPDTSSTNYSAVPLHVVDLLNFDEVDAILSNYAQIDILVNCAGINPTNISKPDPTNPKSWDQFDEIVLGNIRTTANASYAAMPHMQPGVIVNLGSIYAEIGPHQSLYTDWQQKPLAYSASKGAIHAMTKWMTSTWKPNVRAVTLTPGGVAQANQVQSPGFKNRFADLVPAGRMATRDEISRALLLIVSNDYINGANIIIDGGMSAW